MFVLLEAVPQSVVAVAPNGTICWGNRAFRQTSGWRLDEIEAGTAGCALLGTGAPGKAGERGLLYVDARDGGRCAETMTVSAIPDETGRLLAVGEAGLDDVFCRVGARGEIQKVGAGLSELLERDGTGVELLSIVAAGDRERMAEELRAAQAGYRGVFHTRVRLVNARGIGISTSLQVIVRDEAQVARDEVFHQMPHALAIVRMSEAGECVLELANAAFAGMAGIGVAGGTARRLDEVLDEETGQQMTAACRQCATGRKRVDLRMERRAESGGLTWTLSLVASGRRAGAGTWILLVVRDVTPELEAMRLLQEKEELYRSVVEAQEELICRMNDDGRFLFVNEAFCRFYGTTTEALIGTRWQEYVPAEDVAEIESRFAQLTPESPFGISNGKSTNATGEERWLEFANRAYFDELGHMREILAVGRDSTARKKAETELVARTAELDTIYQNSPVILTRFDLRGVLKSVSPSCTQSLGWSADEMVGRTAEWIDHPEDRAEIIRVVSQATEGTDVVRMRHRVRARDGEYRWWASTMRRTGETIYSGSVDITEQVATEQALLREQAFHETLFRTMSQRVVYQTAGGDIRDANPAA